MTALTASIKRKLSLLQLAEELGNVAKAAKIMGFHRDTFYEVRRAFQAGGVPILKEISATLRQMDMRLARLETVAQKLQTAAVRNAVTGAATDDPRGTK